MYCCLLDACFTFNLFILTTTLTCIFVDIMVLLLLKTQNIARVYKVANPYPSKGMLGNKPWTLKGDVASPEPERKLNAKGRCRVGKS